MDSQSISTKNQSGAWSWIYSFILGLTEPRFRRALGKAVWWTLPFVTRRLEGKNGRSRWPLIQKMTYELISELITDSGMTVMNLGYAGLETPHTITISEEDEENRFAFQLYDYLFKFSDSAGKDVLEVGCGRGGGAKFLFKTYWPRSYLGVDFAKANIAFCNRVHSENGLSYKVGRAECLDLRDSSFDTVINIESSHCYTSPGLFFNEAQRVLKPGGMFLFADIRGEAVASDYQTMPILNAQLNELSDMALVTRTNITKNVIRALELSGEAQVKRWTRIIKKNLNRSSRSQRFVERIIEPELCDVFSTQVSESKWNWYNLFKSGKAEYWAYVLQKKG